MRVDMRVDVAAVQPLRFSDGAPVRAASALARLGAGWLIAQDDATHACWWSGRGGGTPVRVLPAVGGHDVFAEADETKHLKPDLEAACEIDVDGTPGVLLLGSGATPHRMRSALVLLDAGEPRSVTADLAPLYAAVARTLEVDPDMLNMEGACVLGDRLRWFQRGLPEAGLPTSSVDLDLAPLVAAVAHGGDADSVEVTAPVRYDLGEVEGVGLGITDGVRLDDRLVLVSAAAEDTPNPRDDGPVVASALALLDGENVLDVVALPHVAGDVAKVEGLSVLHRSGSSARVLATVDADEPTTPSALLELRVRW